MINYLVIDPVEWDEVIRSIQFCIMPKTVAELENNYSIPFFSIIEEGLGNCYYSFIKIHNSKFKLRNYGVDKDDDSGILIDIRSFEESPNQCIELLSNAFGIGRDEFKWLKDNLPDAKWPSKTAYLSSGKKTSFTFIEEEAAALFDKLLTSSSKPLLARLESRENP